MIASRQICIRLLPFPLSPVPARQGGHFACAYTLQRPGLRVTIAGPRSSGSPFSDLPWASASASICTTTSTSSRPYPSLFTFMPLPPRFGCSLPPRSYSWSKPATSVSHRRLGWFAAGYAALVVIIAPWSELSWQALNWTLQTPNFPAAPVPFHRHSAGFSARWCCCPGAFCCAVTRLPTAAC